MTNNFEEYLGQQFNDYSSFEHAYFSKLNDHIWTASKYCLEIVRYISGNVVRALRKNIHCKFCFELINGTNDKAHNDQAKLTRVKNEGGLIFACADIEHICITVERVIRQFKKFNYLRTSNIFQRLMIETLKILPKDILDDNIHIFDFEPLYDHRHSLILLICQIYIDCRMKHESANFNDTLERLRMHSNKTTIFTESTAKQISDAKK